jgi:hypothetical protein
MTKPKLPLRSLTVRLEPREFEAVEALAQAERRPVANLVRLLIAGAVADRSNRRGAAAA